VQAVSAFCSAVHTPLRSSSPVINSTRPGQLHAYVMVSATAISRHSQHNWITNRLQSSIVPYYYAALRLESPFLLHCITSLEVQEQKLTVSFWKSNITMIKSVQIQLFYSNFWRFCLVFIFVTHESVALPIFQLPASVISCICPWSPSSLLIDDDQLKAKTHI